MLPAKKNIIGHNYISKLNLHKDDVIAGVIVAIFFIPQSLAYASLAGVDPIIGLYAGTIPIFIYAIFGSSKHLSIGPVSIVSLLAFTGIAPLAQPGSSSFLEHMIILGFMVGIIQLLLGIFNIGLLVDGLSHAVISGFTAAIAIVIMLNQVSAVFGLSNRGYHSFPQFLEQLKHAHPYTMLIGIGCIICMVVVKKYIKISIGPFLALLVSTSFVYYFQLDKSGVEIIGSIPAGLPTLMIPQSNFEIVKALLPVAISIAFVSFLESYAVAKAIAKKASTTLSPKQELFGLGFANISTSFVGSIPIAGAFSRTALNYQSGAKTKMASLITAVVIFVSLLFLTPLLYYLPKAALGAIIILAVMKLIDLRQIKDYAKHSEKELFLYIVTFLIALMIDIFTGLIIGICLSVLLNIIRIIKINI
jgi:sulfate permease, SulP family